MDDATQLRSAGLRVTAARLAILDVVRSGNHLDAERIASAVRDKVGQVSTQAVYQALHALTDARLVRRIEPAGSPARYEGRVGDNHHHLVCRVCGEVTDVDCLTEEAPCLTPGQTAGFQVDEAEVVFWGTCPDCQTHRSQHGPAGGATAKAGHTGHMGHMGHMGHADHAATSASAGRSRTGSAGSAGNAGNAGNAVRSGSSGSSGSPDRADRAAQTGGAGVATSRTRATV